MGTIEKAGAGRAGSGKKKIGEATHPAPAFSIAPTPTTLHTAAAPAVCAAVKTWLPCRSRNHKITVIFCTANTNTDNASDALSSSNSKLENSEFNLIQNYIFFSE